MSRGGRYSIAEAGRGTAVGRRGAPRAPTSGRCSSSHSVIRRVSAARRALALDDGDDLVVVARRARRAAPWRARSRRCVATATMPSRDEAEVVALVDRSPASQVASRTARVTSPATTLRPASAMASALLGAGASGSYASSAANPSAMPRVGTTRTVFRSSASTCSATGDDVLVVGQDHHLVGRRRLDGLEELGGRGVHRLAAGHDVVHAERAEDAADAVAGGHGHHARVGDRPGRRRLGPAPRAPPPRAPTAPPRPARPGRSPGCSRGRPASRAGLDGRADVVGVDVAVPQAVAADDDDRVADPGPHVLEGRDVSSGASRKYMTS